MAPAAFPKLATSMCAKGYILHLPCTDGVAAFQIWNGSAWMGVLPSTDHVDADAFISIHEA